MPLLKDGAIIDDPWQDGNGILVDLETWQANREALINRNTPLGLALKPGEAVEPLGPDVHCFALITLEFPTFTDGRPYSAARLLRERFGYAGELRATGEVQRDQLLFLKRCGFNAFEVTDEAAAAYAAAIAEISIFYQPVETAEHDR
jgi:uncharacterized protein (DUF934 family)